ncbi:DUF2079 domain-containing protein [Streptomyces sp. TRM66268-LWL]|uniref:DUF2079 domain-containing protein n=1 Tax=Streptomyces polyasparticus TaxID=2767826 RepID=A0ABR7SN29_9ACTN|nr:DUF2079 domain-containing protein [Streptomyces polyasparticus]MBC9716764.1 DUF2079 domain-containing protein [Streptomyces polyasparticus]
MRTAVDPSAASDASGKGADEAAASSGVRKGARRARDTWGLAPWGLAGLLFVAYTTVSVLRWEKFGTRSWDLGIFEQAIRGYAQLQAPIADLKGPGAHILGDHFSPVTALIAPFYRLFPGPVTLLVAQAALFALSVVPVTRAASRLLGRGGGLCLGLAYGLSWGLQRAVDFDFHEIAFAVPLIAFSLEALLAERWRAALLWALPLVLVKEDQGPTLTAIALVVAWRAHGRVTSGRGEGGAGAVDGPDVERARTAVPYAFAVAAFGVVAALLVFFWIIPAFNTLGSYEYWNRLDGGFPSPFAGFEVKLHTLAWLLLPTGLFALRSPLALIALPTLGWRFVSSDDSYWGTDWHYSAVLMPVIVLAAADGIARTLHGGRPKLRRIADRAPLAIAAVALALTVSLPLGTLTDTATYRVPAYARQADALLGRIPDGATVESNIGPISRLAGRCRVLWIGNSRGVTPDYLALDNRAGRYRDPVAEARRLHPDARFQELGSAGGFLVLERVV